ncbi:hypothetical protein H6G33_10735 [Calothrix sp. FACHB-1219]|uniref:hypothetical protein n=1 Tax=unclassified Calothrix TaxID=2619626 RepID=UPI001688FC8C|nr:MULTISPECIES: hypothetical protein [unclassified Calothrix]MBD2201824.1 hypothetical protein [Calothrix sp. FACHB-168]MBD2217510.1 hypothetical protein [Calothrix sp. FACHB-1219]
MNNIYYELLFLIAIAQEAGVRTSVTTRGIDISIDFLFTEVDIRLSSMHLDIDSSPEDIKEVSFALKEIISKEKLKAEMVLKKFNR